MILICLIIQVTCLIIQIKCNRDINKCLENTKQQINGANMIKAIILRDTLLWCDYRRRELKLNPNECIMITNSMKGHIREKLMGRYNGVMNGTIELDGLTKDDFEHYYLGMYKDTVLETSSLAGKELKIVKGYLKGNIIKVEDWFEKVTGQDLQYLSFNNAAGINYAMNHKDIMFSEEYFEALYGKIGGLGYVVSVSELELPADYDVRDDYKWEEKWV